MKKRGRVATLGNTKEEQVDAYQGCGSSLELGRSQVARQVAVPAYGSGRRRGAGEREVGEGDGGIFVNSQGSRGSTVNQNYFHLNGIK